MARYVPDSNVFLQCRPLEGLDWAGVTADTAVELKLVAQVYRELDRLKQGGNARRSKRARRWVERLRPIALGDTDEVVLRESGPRLSLRLAPRLAPGALAGHALDLDVADERIVAEALAYAQASGEPLALLSDDGMPLRAAREMGLAAVAVPSTWQADPEPDESQRRVAELERQVAGLVRQTPKIEVRAAVNLSGRTRLEGVYDVWPELSPAFVEHVGARLRTVHPGPARPTGIPALALEAQGFDYGLANYEAWVKKIAQRLEASARLAYGFSNPFLAQLVFENTGSAGADDLVIDVHSRGDVRLVEIDALAELREKLSEAFPAPPKPRSLFGLAEMRETLLSPHPRFAMPPTVRLPRAVSEFAWNFESPAALSASCRGECTEFRHGLQPEVLEFGLRPPLNAEGDVEGALQVRVSARNLGVTHETVVPVVLRCQIRDTERYVAERLLRDLDVVL